MTKGTLPPLGMRCALAQALVTSLGTATACPSPSDWSAQELAAYQIGDFRGNWAALFHDRSTASVASLSMDCWSRAAAVGIVQ